MFYNNKYNKRIRTSSPDNYEEEYIDLILDDSSNICEKENEKNTAEEQINKVYTFLTKFLLLILYSFLILNFCKSFQLSLLEYILKVI
jgi:hypothetical protein